MPKIQPKTEHVRYGQKWLPILLERMGEGRSTEQLKTEAENWRREVLAASYRPAAAAFEMG
jgi:hypothetical protein